MGPLVALEVAAERPPATGVAKYVAGLAHALLARYPEQVRLIGVHPHGGLAGLAGGHSIDGADRPQRRYSSWLLRRAEAEAREHGVRVLHFTNGFAPLSTELPFVLTIHDLSLLREPRSHPPARLLMAPLMVVGAVRAAAVIVPSQATARDVVRTLRVPPERISIIVEAPAELTSVSPDEARSRLARHRLAPQGYVLSLGTIDGRKNHVRLLHAFELLLERRPDLRLVIAGLPERGSRALGEAIARSSAPERVVCLGYVDEVDRSVLLCNAGAVAYVSLLEGFGLPIVEGMAAGAPVVTAAGGATAETAAGAAVLVDPYSPASIAAGIAEALERRDFLATAGRRRVQDLSWHLAAERTMGVYEAVARRSSGGRDD